MRKNAQPKVPVCCIIYQYLPSRILNDNDQAKMTRNNPKLGSALGQPDSGYHQVQYGYRRLSFTLASSTSFLHSSSLDGGLDIRPTTAQVMLGTGSGQEVRSEHSEWLMTCEVSLTLGPLMGDRIPNKSYKSRSLH
jgi:hypothetical protein